MVGDISESFGYLQQLRVIFPLLGPLHNFARVCCFIHSSSNIWPFEGQELCVLLIYVSFSSAAVHSLREWHCPDRQAVCSHQGKVDESVLSARFCGHLYAAKREFSAVPEGLSEALCGWGESWRCPHCVRHFRPKVPWGKSTGASNTAWEGHLPKLKVFLRKRQRKMRLGRKPRSDHRVLMPH